MTSTADPSALLKRVFQTGVYWTVACLHSTQCQHLNWTSKVDRLDSDISTSTSCTAQSYTNEV